MNDFRRCGMLFMDYSNHKTTKNWNKILAIFGLLFKVSNHPR